MLPNESGLRKFLLCKRKFEEKFHPKHSLVEVSMSDQHGILSLRSVAKKNERIVVSIFCSPNRYIILAQS